MLELLQTIGIVTGSLCLALLVAGKIIGRHVARIRGVIGEQRVRALIESIGLPAVHDFIATDSNGIMTQIDHAVRVPAGIIIIETKNFSGRIYTGTRRTRRWTAFYGPVAHRFQNPLHQNFRHVETLRQRHPTVDFLGIVCFAGGHFPKGPPSGVIMIDALASMLRALSETSGETNINAETAWAEITTLAATTTRGERRQHITQLKNRVH